MCTLPRTGRLQPQRVKGRVGTVHFCGVSRTGNCGNRQVAGCQGPEEEEASAELQQRGPGLYFGVMSTSRNGAGGLEPCEPSLQVPRETGGGV